MINDKLSRFAGSRKTLLNNYKEAGQMTNGGIYYCIVKRFIHLTLVIGYLTLAISAPVFAEIVGQTDDPTVIGGGARSLGMGKAFAAVANDADTMFINPAGLASLKGPQAMTMFTSLLGGQVYYSEYCGAVPVAFGTVGLGYIVTGTGQIETEVNNETVYTDYYDSLFLLSYGTPLARFFGYGRNVFVGTNLKVFGRGWSGGINDSAIGYSADLGVKLVCSPYLSFGINRQNIVPPSLGGVVSWGTGAEETLASLTKVGIAVKPLPLRGSLLLAFDVDLSSHSSRPTTMHVGSEWKINPYLTLRGGMDQSVDADSASQTYWNPTGGASIQVFGFRVDYAYHPYYNDSTLATRYVSLSYIGEPTRALRGEASPLIGRAR